MGCAADESWNRATKARLNLATDPAKYIGKYRPKLRELRICLRQDVCADLNPELYLDMNPRSHRALLVQFYPQMFKTLFQQFFAKSFDSMFKLKYGWL